MWGMIHVLLFESLQTFYPEHDEKPLRPDSGLMERNVSCLSPDTDANEAISKYIL